MSQAHIVPPPGAPSSPKRLRDLGLAWEHLGRVEVGFGSAVWLRMTPAATSVRTLGRELRAWRIGETGQVPEIEVENREREPLLVPAHVVLAGGWQTRAVERSVVVGGGGSARVPVKCVEAGRWAPRDERTAASFEVEGRTGVRTRWSASRSMAEQLRSTGRYAAEQAAIWQHVDEELTRSPVGSRTRSYEAWLRGVKEPFVAQARSADVRPPPGANAVVLLPRGGGFWLEAYPTDGALAENVVDLLADLFDPEARGEGGVALEPEALLARLGALTARPLDPVAGSTGDAFALDAPDDDPTATAGALVLLDGALAHLGVGASGGPVKALSPSGVVRSAPQAPTAGASGARVPSTMATGLHTAEVRAVEGEVLDRPRVDADTMRAVFARARDLMPEEPPARERIQGFRLVRVLDRSISWVDVRIGGDGYAVVGSHDRCDLVLGADPGIWLRHLAAVCVRLEDGSVGLRLIDLKTDLPFFLEDDTPRASILATGPFAIRLARHVVCGFPIGPLTGEERPSPQAREPGRHRDIDMSATGVLETLASRSGAGPSLTMALDDFQSGASARPVRPATEITSFVSANAISPLSAGSAGHAEAAGGPQAPAEPSASAAPDQQADHVRVTLERGGMGASVELPVDALDSGVLLGRALNCFDGGLRRIFCEAISRAHVLLLRDHEDVYAYDLCSTNGTRAFGHRIRRQRLADAGTTLELGKKVIFRWKR